MTYKAWSRGFATLAIGGILFPIGEVAHR